MISYIFNFRPFEESTPGCLAVWQQSGILVRLVYSLICVHFAQFIQSVQKICVSLTLNVAYFIFAILFTVSDYCISSFATSIYFVRSFFLSSFFHFIFFDLSPIFLLFPTLCFYYLRTNNINSKKKMNRK